ncbi:MAG: carbohydrate ABC transporter permease [Treponemataceae bacterium]
MERIAPKRFFLQFEKPFLTVLGIALTALFLFPLYWMIITAIQPPGSAFHEPVLFPRTLSVNAFIVENAHGISLATYFKNSVLISLGTTLLTIFLGIPASYSIARIKSKFTGTLLLVFLIAQMLPSSLILTPLFIIFNKLGLINSYFSAIIADTTTTIPFTVVVLRTFFKDVPESLEEAAIIDGCGTIGVFTKIMIPICYPGIIVASIMSLFMSWGDMVFSLTFINKEKMKPLALILYNAMGELGVRWEILMAYATIVVAPIVILFVFAQRYMVAGLTTGAVKG